MFAVSLKDFDNLDFDVLVADVSSHSDAAEETLPTDSHTESHLTPVTLVAPVTETHDSEGAVNLSPAPKPTMLPTVNCAH